MEYKFVISSLNTEKLINKLCLKFDIFDIKKTETEISFCCKKKDRKKIQKILNKCGYKTKNTFFVGFFKHLKNITSVGIIIGTILSIALWCVSCFFITDVLILGNISITSKEIMEVLKTNNINKWSLKSSVNIQNLETQIQDIKYISYVSAIIKGNALIINVKEQLTNDEVVSIGSYAPIVSNYDCKITSIKLIQGTLKVKVGDIVKLGDVLVEPYVQKPDGTTLSVQPIADIVGDVWITSSLDFYNTLHKKVRTNKVVSNYSVTFMGIEIYKKDTNVNFKNYEIEEYETYLSTSILPIKIKYKNFYEYTTEEINVDFEKNKDKFIEETRKTVLLNVKEYDIIKNESYKIYNNDDYNTVLYTITLNKKIC